MKVKLGITFFWTFFILSECAYSQTQEQRDSLVNLICNVIVNTKGVPDSVRVQIAFEEHLYPFIVNYPEDEMESIGMSIYYRLQRNCGEFNDILARAEPTGGDWKSVSEKPASNLSKRVCRKFLTHKSYKYLESSGDTVNVKIEKGYWSDYFKDGSYSRLKFYWVSDCEFEIEFIESNNEIRTNFSNPGDRYRYTIIDKREGYYDMSLEIIGIKRYFIFKIYY